MTGILDVTLIFLALLSGSYAVAVLSGNGTRFCEFLLGILTENRLSEVLLPYIMRIVMKYTKHNRIKMTEKERGVYLKYLDELQETVRSIYLPSSEKPVIVAMIGLIGSGKTTTAKIIAKEIGAVCIDFDRIRVLLRKADEGYGGTRKVAECLVSYFIGCEVNVVLDSDHVDQCKRAVIRDLATELGVSLYLIRTVADFDVTVGRIIQADYRKTPDDFFGGASSPYEGDIKTKGAVVKIRELWRRTPNHFNWLSSGGGKWVLKKLPFEIDGLIDTSKKDWKLKTEETAQSILDKLKK